MKILGIPFRIQEGRVKENVDKACQIIDDEMQREKADLIVLPEMFTCGYPGLDLTPYAEPMEGPTYNKFKTLSEKWDVLIGYGFAEMNGTEKVFNSWALIEPGTELMVYRKNHMHPSTIPSLHEETFLLPGKDLAPFKTRSGNIGVMICYDGCFVEVPRTLVLKGADIIIWPSFGNYFASHSIPPTRGLDNVVPIVLLAGGVDGKNVTCDGWSMVVSEQGDILVNHQSDGDTFRVNIDLEKSRKFRTELASGSNSLYKTRRPDLYTALVEEKRHK